MTDPELSSIERALRDQAPRAAEPEAERAAARLAERADEAGLVEVAYDTVDTPVGRMLVATTPRGLVRLELPGQSFEQVLEDLAARVSPRLLELARRTDDVRRQLDEYFAGSRREFDLPLDWRLVRGEFARRLLGNMTRVPYGEAITYTQAAAQAGSPRGSRAAGNALGSNPIPVIVPCHRVVRTGGAIGGYGGGPETKRFLLRHEGWLD
ncbi:MAG: methylated-DNA--[protein]-cysteine S-methyltransferase [bacterium]